MSVLLVADDLTGAGDSGIQLVEAGLHTRILLSPRAEPQGEKVSTEPPVDRGAGSDGPAVPDVLVLDTDSRHLPPEKATARVRAAFEALPPSSGTLLVKKIDSTLRGNVGPELEAALAASGAELAVLTPAYPAQDRTVRDGVLYVSGRRLETTEFGDEGPEADPVSSIPTLLRRQIGSTVETIDRTLLHEGDRSVRERLDRCAARPPRIAVCDAETPSDLRRIVRYGRHSGRRILWVGSAGLVGALAVEAVGEEETGVSRPLREGNDCSRPGAGILFVVGSLHARSRRQLDLLLETGSVAPFEVDPHLLLDGTVPEAEGTPVATRIREALRTRSGAALYTPKKPVAGPNESDARARIAGGLAGIARRAVRTQDSPPLLFLTGGETARAVCTMLGITGLDLIRAVEEGVPMARAVGEWNGPLITKAGGFGTEEVMTEALRLAR